MPRFTVDLDDKFDSILTELVKTTAATTKADVIRRAVASYKYLKDNTKDGEPVSIVDKNNVAKDVMLP